MKKSILCRGVVLGCLLYSGSALAATSPFFTVSLGSGGLGAPYINPITSSGLPTKSSCEKFYHKLSWGVSAGLMNNFMDDTMSYGFEIGFIHNGSQHSPYGQYRSRDIDIMGLARYNIAGNWNVLGKAGLTMLDQHISDGVNRRSQWGIRPKVAIGVGYNIQTNMQVALTYSHIYTGHSGFNWHKNNLVSVNNMVLSLSYSF